jgi:serine/threonine protein kinase
LNIASCERLFESHNVWKVVLKCETGKKFHAKYGPLLIIKAELHDPLQLVPNEVEMMLKYNSKLLPVLDWRLIEGGSRYLILMPLLTQDVPSTMSCLERYAKATIMELHKIHCLGIIHRDIKPSNICYDSKTGICTIIDFGVATDKTDCNLIPGTRKFMSPDLKISPKSDVWSLGRSLLEILVALKKLDLSLEVIGDCYHRRNRKSTIF